MLDYDERQAINRELNRHETIEWSEKANPVKRMKESLPFVLFAIPWTAFSLFWIVGASGFQIPDFKDGFDFFPLFGIPFVLVGIGMLISPYFSYQKAKRTLYVITNQRIMEIILGKKKTIKNYLPEDIGIIERAENSDGSGDLFFATATHRDSDDNTRTVKVGFKGVSEVKRAERAINKLKALRSQ